MNKLIFDVESTSLHGEAFAFGAIVFDENNNNIDRLVLMSCDVALNASDWVKENILPHLKNIPTCKTGLELRNAFYDFYIKHKDTCEIWSDCNFPVETNFLSAIVNDDIKNREFNMPYPLYDVCNFVHVDVDRNEVAKLMGLRKHHPYDDAMASYFCLIDSDLYRQSKNK